VIGELPATGWAMEIGTQAVKQLKITKTSKILWLILAGKFTLFVLAAPFINIKSSVL
jgi:predicted regulator of Ras-like GTPase activity (Roadblock/LC7/MglB family)